MTEYFKIIEAKDGNLIPVCRNTDTNTEISIQSKYNPVREAESFVSQINIPASFFVVLGIGAGFHILKLLQKFPESKILAVELSDNAINFLSGLPSFNEISNNKSIQITSISNLETMLLSLYKPAIHGNLSLISLRQWETVFQNDTEKAKKIINNSIKLLSADFSVQSHFGKIWQKNILSNLSIAEKTKNWEEISKKIQNDVKLKKTAAIIAAGPSLNENISELKQNRHKYFIIATDTAFSSLLKQNIKSDAVISIDGQQVSHEHYLEILPENTLYIFDLCASPSSVRKALKFSKNVLFIQTGHPLSQYASYFEGNQNFLNLEAGSGTVTIAAASFAQKAGFSNKDIK
ncbi:6-hydroxymethylpterin diphosphokinase MptE-like protein, partial [Treponema sp.]|uniref:6-hydroxymethylpterin diphosphokinase MptE-like protein n=1 Tax=Treponema sp. TaxID=166 RepID=UPI00388EC2F8